ncbi:hypothetical protein BH11ACT8_BH11ACT8_01820 [soil metagenome]
MPIDPVDCRHCDGRTYVQDRTTKRWWSRDFAGHAEVAFKTYRLTDGWFEFVADHDDTGNVVADKHKGPEFKRFRESATNGCAHFARHVGE